MTLKTEEFLLSNRIPDSTEIDIQDLLCSICLDIVWQPIVCGSCQTFFCSKCLNDWLTHPRTKCPMRCETFIQGQCPEFLIQRLSQLHIECIHHLNGCKKIINYNDLENHQDQCDYKRELCPKCQVKFLKNNLTQHVNDCKKVKAAKDQTSNKIKRTTRKTQCSVCRNGDRDGRRSCTRGGNGNFSNEIRDPDGWYFDYGDSWDNPCHCKCHDN